jgi:hypothetical protein
MADVTDYLKYIPGVGEAIGGLGQLLFSGRKKAMREYEAQLNNAPKVGSSTPINKYYNEALNRYNENIYNGTLYNYQKQNAERSFNSGVNAYGDRRGALAGIGKLSAIQDDAMLKAGIAAEQQKNQRFGVLGNATNMKYGDDKYVYNNNVLMPYQRKLQQLQMKFSGANDTQNAGLSNMFQGASNIATILGGKAKPTPTAATAATGSLPSLLGNRDGSATIPDAIDNRSLIDDQNAEVANPFEDYDFSTGRKKIGKI